MNHPEQRTPALDFLRQVQVWQQSPGGTAGIAVAMPGGEERTLTQLLGSFTRDAANPGYLEQKARMWLVGYREMNPPLTEAQRRQLDDVIDRRAWYAEPARERPSAAVPDFPLRRAAVVMAVVTMLCVVALVAQHLTATRHDDTPPPGGTGQQQGQQQVPAGTTDLQDFEHDWGPFTQVSADPAHPQTASPRLLLMRDGNELASSWGISAKDPSWNQDLSGSITAVDVRGTYAVITDADGNTWVVGTDQPFVLSRDPSLILRADPAGVIWSTSTAHGGTSGVRYPVK